MIAPTYRCTRCHKAVLATKTGRCNQCGDALVLRAPAHIELMLSEQDFPSAGDGLAV